MKQEKRGRPFAEFLKGCCDDQPAREAATLYVEGFHAARAERAGTPGLTLAEEASDSVEGDSSFRVLGGYSRVVEWLNVEVGAGGGRVQLGAAAREVRWSRGRGGGVAPPPEGGGETIYKGDGPGTT